MVSRAFVLVLVCLAIGRFSIAAEDSLAGSRDLSRPGADDPYGPSRRRNIGEILRTFHPQQETVAAKTIHAVLIVDDRATGVEEAARRDRDAIAGLLDRAFAGSEVQVKRTTLTGEDLTPEKVVRCIAQLQAGPNDTLFVYFTGHGETETTDEVIGEVRTVNGPRKIYRTHHMLKLGNKRLARANLRVAMEKKDARLNVLITDCCRPLARGANPARAPLNPDFKVLDKFDIRIVNKAITAGLFTRQSGFIDVSTGNALSDPKTGGVLTHSFVGACCYQKADFVGQPRTKPPSGVRGLAIAPTRIDRNADGLVDWREFQQLWLHLIVSLSAAEQSALMDVY